MGFLAGWGRRKSKIINGSTAGAQTNFQMMITVNKSSGVDTSTNLYLGTNVRNDFGDVRFTSSDGTTLLDYWIESVISGVSANIWIEIASIPASPSTTNIYIYYDNASQTTTSSGTNTFIKFSTGTDFASWTGTTSNVNGELRLQGTGYSANRLPVSISRPFIIESRFKVVTTSLVSVHFMFGAGSGTTASLNNNTRSITEPFSSLNNWHCYTPETGWKSITSSPFSQGTYYILKETVISSNNYNHQLLDSNRSNLGLIIGTNNADGSESNPTTSISYESGNYHLFVRDVLVTWLFARKTSSPEPTFGATEASSVVNVTSTSADGTYTSGVIPITIQFEESVTVTGTPQIQLETGATDRQAPYSSGSGSTILTLNYTVQPGDSSSDLDYVATNSFTLNGGTIIDISSNNATLTLPTPGATGSLSANKNIVISAPSTTIPSLGNLYSVVQRGMTFAAGVGASLGRRKTKLR